MHFDLPHLIRWLGYFGVWAIVFAESGLLVGFFLPGNSLLSRLDFWHPNLKLRVLTFGF
jgi:membrane-associated protein